MPVQRTVSNTQNIYADCPQQINRCQDTLHLPQSKPIRRSLLEAFSNEEECG
jgi:hypothetical protein